MNKLKEIREEISTWKYLASTLTQPHQQNVKFEINNKIANLEALLTQLRNEIEK